MSSSSFFKVFQKPAVLWALLAVGFCLRLYRVGANEFLFYDEGMYLGQDRYFLNLVAANPPQSLKDVWAILGLMFKFALHTPKALWFFLLDLRVFMTGVEGWYFARLVSAAAGIGAVVLTFVWARRYYQSLPTAILAAAILCLLPSHVFYSRLGMQEALSGLLFLAGMFFYVWSPRGAGLKSFISAMLMGAVFLTNYRMIVAPAFIFLAEVWAAKTEGRPIDWQKFLWFNLAFACLIFGLGSLYEGANTYVNFAWMFHQAQESHSHRSLINFFSFPYYIFSLEGILFGLALFGNFFWMRPKQWQRLLPFALVLLQMGIFSFAAEKGARYLCVVLPFAAMAAAHCIEQLLEAYPRQAKWVYALTAVLFISFGRDSLALARAQTDYGKAIGLVLSHDPQAKIISTQPLVEGLFLKHPENIAPCPMKVEEFAALVAQGYRYLIIDPQAYISWTASQERFVPPLVPYLEMLRSQLKPVAVLPHIQGVLLRRFVLDHNQDLDSSLKFLQRPEGKGEITIYQLK